MPRPRLLTAPFLIAGLASLVHGLAIHSYLHIPGFLSGLGAREDTIGFVFSAMAGAAIAIRPVAGRLMDGVGRRVAIVGGGVLHVVACALFLTVSSIGPWLFLVRVVQGFASGAIFSGLFTYAADIVPASRRAEGMGIFGVSGLLPVSLGGLLGDAVLAAAGWRTFFIVTAGLALLGLLVSLALREPPRLRASAGDGRGFLRALTQPDLVPIWFVGSSFACGLTAVFAFMRTFVESPDGVGTVGFFFTWYSLSAIAVRIGLGWVPDRMGLKRVFFPSMGLVGLSLLTVAAAHDHLVLALAAVIAGIGHGYAFPILSALTVNRAEPAHRGSAVGLFTAIFDAGVLVGGPLLGTVARTTDLRTMYVVAALIPWAGAAVFWAWDREATRAPTRAGAR
ncbi:MAG: MFS transporter [Sandaracinaceae bacterium]